MTAELPFSQLTWTEFEELIAALARDADDLAEVRRYGEDGQRQDGVDVIGFTRADGQACAYQCKRVARFTESDLSRAVAGFAGGIRPFSAARLVVAVAVPARRKQVLHRLAAERARYPELDFRLWDATDLSDLLREQPRIVERFFGKDAARAFCFSGSFSSAAAPDDVCPYPGLAPFEPEQAQWFFGRTAVVAEICQRMDGLLTAAGPLVVIGPSGAGKSSLLRAGVMPALGQGRLPISWPCVLMTPTSRPAHALAERMSAIAAGDPRRRAVLLVDQFEEVFTLCPDEQERSDFIDELMRMADRPAESAGTGAAAVVVLCVRADFYDHCLRYGPLRSALRANSVLLGPMPADELRAAITSPAEAAGLRVEPGLPELLLNDAGLADQAGDQAARLPLIAHALRATWQHRQGRFLTVDGYRMTGGIRGAVATTAEREFSLLDAAGQRLAKMLFLRLVKVGDGTVDVCRPASRDVLLRDLPGDVGAADILDRFTRARLLTQEQDTVTIAHDALLSSWPRLSGWIASGRADHLIRQQLDEAAAAWKHDRDASVLYRGKRLTTVRAWAGGHEAGLGASAAGFLAASIRKQHRARAALMSAVAMAAALVLAVSVTSVIAIGEHDAAARTRDQAAYSQAISRAGQEAPNNPQLAAQLDLAAYRLRQSPAVAASLIATENTPLYSQLPAAAGAVAFSPDRDLFATGGTLVQLWEMTGAGQARPLGHPFGRMPPGSTGGIEAMAFSRDSRTLAAIGNGTLWLWNVLDPAHPHLFGITTKPVPVTAQAVAFSPDGSLLAIGGRSRTSGVVRLWDVSDPGHPRPLDPPLADHDGIAVTSVSFSPDGHTLAAGSTGGYVRLWDVARFASPAPVGEPLAADSGTSAIDAVAFSPDGTVLAISGTVGGVQLWNVASPARPYRLGPALPGCTGGSGSAAFGRNGLLVTGCGDGDGTGGSVQLWDVSSRSQPTPVSLPQAVAAPVGSLAVSPDSRTLVSVSKQDTVLLWSLPPVMLSDGPVGAVAYNQQRAILASTGFAGAVQLWTLDSPRGPVPLGPPLGPRNAIDGPLAFSPDGRLLASGETGSVQLWQLADLRRSVKLRVGSSGSISSLAFSSRDGILAVGDDIAGSVQLWAVTSPGRPRKLSSVSGGSADGAAVAFSPDGAILASGDASGDVHLWHVSDPSRPRPAGRAWQATSLPIGGISSLAFSPRGHLLVTGAEDGTVQLWNVADPARPVALGQPLNDAVGSYITLAFSADGTVLVIAGQHDSVQRWDIADPVHPRPIGQPLTVSADPAMMVSALPGVTSAPLTLAGSMVITGSINGDTQAWDMNVHNAINRICAIPGDELTPGQWRRYIPQLPYIATCPASARNQAAHLS